MIYQILPGSNDLYGKDLFPTCLWSRTIPENPFVMETKRGWHRVEEGEIKGVGGGGGGWECEMMAHSSGRLHSI